MAPALYVCTRRINVAHESVSAEMMYDVLTGGLSLWNRQRRLNIGLIARLVRVRVCDSSCLTRMPQSVCTQTESALNAAHIRH
jgi:hypothetical protein